MKAFFFGCVGRPGHFFYGLDGAKLYYSQEEKAGVPWKDWEIDGALQPGCYDWHGSKRHGEEVEGESKIHHKDGWTALSFWDRSVDARGASNGNFFFEGTFNFEEAKNLAIELFPSIVTRFNFVLTEAKE